MAVNLYDERDNVQARQELIPGSERWEEFYRVHPELKDVDMAQFNLPGGMDAGAQIDNKFFLSMVALLGELGHEKMVDGSVEQKKIDLSPERHTEKIKGMAGHLGVQLTIK